MVATQFKARVWELATISGTASVTLSGVAQTGCEIFKGNITSGNLTPYLLFDPAANVWETGIGAFTSGTVSTLTRSVIESSNNNSAVSFTGNQCNVTVSILSPTQVSSGVTSAGLIPALNPSGVIDPSMNLAAATYQGSVVNPTEPTSTSAFTMQGLSATIVPVKTGNLLATVNGSIFAVAGTSATYGIQYRLAYAAGSAPSNGATLQGTTFGPTHKYEHGVAITAADTFRPFSISGIIAGLSLGSTYWVDLQAESVTTASEVGLSGVCVTLAELS
jgi:hypothetical protein